MSDVQARVTEVLVKHQPTGEEPIPEWTLCSCGGAVWDYAAHVTAMLAEAGLLAHTDGRARLRLANALAGAERERDAARAELAEVRHQRDRAEGIADERGAALDELEAVLADAERRGAVAALREAADRLDEMDEPWPDRPRLHQDHAEWLRARADRIEGEDRG